MESFAVLIDEDFRGCGVRLARGEGYCRAPGWRLTTRYHGYTIGGKNDEGQYTSLRVEMGNPNFSKTTVVDMGNPGLIS